MSLKSSTPKYFFRCCCCCCCCCCFVYGVYLRCIFPLRGTSPDYFLFRLIEERRLIIDFNRSLRSLGPVVNTTPEEFKKRNNYRSFYIFVWGNFGQGNHVVLLILSCSKRCVVKCFPSTRKLKAGVFKFLRFKERFRETLFSWRIALDRGPNRRNKAVYVFKFLRRSVGGVWSKPRRQWAPPNKRFNEQNKDCTSVFSKPSCNL